MKISAITSNYANLNEAQSFKGLWGKTSKNIDRDPVLRVPAHYETYYYYPCADETQEQIHEVVNKYNKAYMDESGDQSVYVVNACKVCTVLPFSLQALELYDKAQTCIDTPENTKIHTYLSRSSDLYKNLEEGQQISAVNRIFDPLLPKKKRFDLEG